ncbi:hypothetical protein POM88_030489 [Heracleum sosnowskyi]|uniref:Uncharacterized protein n=1 Tax=Heracleum sosnowskyi TaxID=360622 RepID=A0AAD8MI47_9APIA|nr:hypothetical protein POM88_030489 [Heracleum sosnowskyi]
MIPLENEGENVGVVLREEIEELAEKLDQLTSCHHSRRFQDLKSALQTYCSDLGLITDLIMLWLMLVVEQGFFLYFVHRPVLDDFINWSQYALPDVEIHEKVDVIVSDWMDQLLIYDYENLLGSILTAKDRLLKPGGFIIPLRATVLAQRSLYLTCGLYT